jgi:lysophospholipid acyltransferase (LPLAT)-like uncharacterized protein
LKYLILNTIGPPLVGGVMRLLRLTLRIEYRNEERVYALARERGSIIFAFWHHDLVVTALTSEYLTRNGAGRFVVLASPSRDGELLARTVKRFGVEAVRGSSSHGARRGVIALERRIRDGRNVGVAVDGPLGPRHKAKIGVALIAKDTGAPIVPFTVHHERAWRVRSWDRTEIPKPFSRIVATLHEPIDVPPDATRDDLERVRAQVEQVLLEFSDNITQHAPNK